MSKEKKYMNFNEMLECLEKGEKVRLSTWQENDYIGIRSNIGIYQYYEDNSPYKQYEFSHRDIHAAHWEIYKPSEGIIFPKDDEKIYYLDECGYATYRSYDETSSRDNSQIKFGNYFKNEEEAKFVAKKLSIIKRLENLASNSLDWKGNDYKYFIFYDCKEEKVSVASDINDKYLPFSIYFRSKKSCENAIKAIGERDLKKYYFDIKDNQ